MQQDIDFNINNESNIIPKIDSLEFCLSKIKNMHFSLGEKTTVRLKEPTEMYVKEVLLTSNLKPALKERIQNYFSKTSITNNKKLIQFDEYDRAEILEKIINSIKHNNEFPVLSKRECRAILSYDKIYTSRLKTHFLQYMKNNYSPSTRIIKTLIITYFNLYNTLRNDEEFKSYFTFVLKKYFEQTKKISPVIEIYIKDCDILNDNFCNDLAKKCLDIKLKTNENLNKIIENRYQLILPNTDIYNELIKEIGIECFKKISEENYFNILVNEILQSKLIKSKMDEIVSKLLILFSGTSNLTSEKQNILRKILLQNKNYGDPRIYPINWEGNISKEARQIFISWLAKEDLEFFFNIVFYNKLDGQGRKTFWKEYIKSRELKYSKVILSHEDINHPKIKEAMQEGREFARFLTSTDGASSFILVFDRATIVEFSKNGNALYIYSNNNSIVRADKMKYGNVNELKKTRVKEYTKHNAAYINLEQQGAIRIRHIDGWQQRTKEYLCRELSIYKGD